NGKVAYDTCRSPEQTGGVNVTEQSAEWFGARLKELRQAKGWTREKLAVAADVSYFTVTKLEQGHRGPTVAVALRLAQARGCALNDLLRPPEGASKKGKGKGKKGGK